MDNKKYWFSDIVSIIAVDEQNARKIADLIFDAVVNNLRNIKNLPKPFHVDNDPRIIFITVGDNLSRAKTFLGSGNGLLNAINDVLALAAEIGPAFNLQSVKLDIVQQVVTIKDHPVDQTIEFDRSLYGLAFDDEIRIAYLPEELVSNTIVNSNQRLLLKNIIKRSRLTSLQKVAMKEAESYTLYPFTTQSFYQSRTIFTSLYRGHRLYKKINTDLLLSSSISAGKYLQDAVKEDGSFIYEYFPKKDAASERYNILRHAGSVYSMLELYEVSKNEALLKSARRVLINLLNRAKKMHVNDEECLCIVENDFVKLGGNGLALLALSKYISISHDTSYLEIGRSLAKWMKIAQNETGAFSIQKMEFSTRKNTNFISLYYPGEAIFSLMRFYQIDPNPAWLEIAQNAADYIINIRDKHKRITQLEHDHWLLYGLNELYRFRPDPIYITHTQKICRAIMGAQYRKQDPPDYLGSFDNPPRSTPVATRAEGLCAAYRLLKDNHYDNFSDDLLEAIVLCIRFQLQTQYQPERTLYLDNPQKPLGGFSSSFTDYRIRIDYVQHNLSSMIGLYNIMLRYTDIEKRITSLSLD